jgi:hypothetical protein
MTTTTQGPLPASDIAVPLRTDGDVLRRIDLLIDQDARQLRSIWLLFVSASGVQLPAVVPIDGVPEYPDLTTARSLCWVIAEALRENVPGGHAVVVLTRPGAGAADDADLDWAATLHRAARDRGASLRMVCLATPSGVCRLGATPPGERGPGDGRRL